MSPSTAPTPKQLSYVKALAEQTGTSCVLPRTRAQAKREIDRLLTIKRGAPALTHEDTSQQSFTYATAVQDDEVSGYGSTASWRRGPDRQSPSAKQLSFIESLAQQTGETVETPDTRAQASHEIDRLLALKRKPQPQQKPTAAAHAAVGEKVELGRYSVSGEPRILYSQQVDGVIRLTDRPVKGHGRSYLVERELEQDDHSALTALVADYLEQAQRLESIPMASSVIRRELERLVSYA